MAGRGPDADNVVVRLKKVIDERAADDTLRQDRVREPGTTLGAAAAAVVAGGSLEGLLRLQAQLCRAKGAAVLVGGRAEVGDVAGWSELAAEAAARAGVEAAEVTGTAGVAVAARLDGERAAVLLCDGQDAAVRMLTAERLVLTAGLWREAQATAAAGDAAAARDRLGRVTQALATFDGEAAELNLCRHVAHGWGATRCSLGIVRGAGVKLRAMSDAAEPAKGRLQVAVADAMAECADQGREVAWPTTGDVAGRAAGTLARTSSAAAVLSLPMLDGDGARAVLTVEWAEGPGDAQELRVLAQLLRPALLARLDAERWVSPRLARTARRVAGGIVGPRHIAAKLAAAAAVGVGVAACVVPGDVPAGGTFVATSADARQVAAPFAGTLRSVDVEAGDAVSAGAVLAGLDPIERQLELSAARARVAAERAKADAALAAGDPTAAELARLEAAAVAARADLLAEQLAAATLVAPAGGIVLHAPPPERLDTPVERGEPLLTVGPAQTRRAEVVIDERDAGELATGQPVVLRPAATPGATIGGVVTQVSPAVEALDGRRVVRVVIEADEPLRHGGEGMAHVTTGRAPLAVVWLRPAWRTLRDVAGY